MLVVNRARVFEQALALAEDDRLSRACRPGKAATVTHEAMIAFHPSALAEIEHARDWYEGKQPGLGEDLVDEVERALTRLEAAPTKLRPYVDEFRTALVELVTAT
jgi:hypothetical protein